MRPPACPCCGFKSVESLAAPIAHFMCGACGHAWRSATAPVDYAGLLGRTVPASADLARRLNERLGFIGTLAPGMRVVEVGCAEGLLGAALRAQLPSLHLTGIEPSADAEAARAHFDVVHTQALGPELLAAADADLVLAFHVLEHIVDPAGAVGLLSAALAPTGRLVLEVPNGSGHPLVSFDGNREHLHFFCASSLTCLLRRAGFETTRLLSGGFESPTYADCLRVEARISTPAAARTAAMAAVWRSHVPPGTIIWGAGGDFECYVRPWLGLLAPLCIVDSNVQRQGRSLDGVEVRAPSVLGEQPGACVLIASYRFEAEILASIAALGLGSRRVITLSEVLSNQPRARASSGSSTEPMVSP